MFSFFVSCFLIFLFVQQRICCCHRLLFDWSETNFYAFAFFCIHSLFRKSNLVCFQFALIDRGKRMNKNEWKSCKCNKNALTCATRRVNIFSTFRWINNYIDGKRWTTTDVTLKPNHFVQSIMPFNFKCSSSFLWNIFLFSIFFIYFDLNVHSVDHRCRCRRQKFIFICQFYWLPSLHLHSFRKLKFTFDSLLGTRIFTNACCFRFDFSLYDLLSYRTNSTWL